MDNLIPRSLARTVWFDGALVLAAVSVATGVRLALDPALGDGYPFITYFGAVAAVAWFGRTPAAVVTLVLCGLLAYHLFIRPRPTVGPPDLDGLVGTGLYFAVAAVVVAMSHAMRLARARAEELLAQALVRQEALRQSLLAQDRQRELLRTTLVSIGDGVITTDPEGRVVDLNPVAESLTGWTTAEAAARPLVDVFPLVNETSRAPVANPVARALADGVVVGLANHTILVARDGTERPIDDSAAPIRAATGEILGCVLVFRDITERHRQESGLRASEARLRELAETSERQRRLYETVLTNTPDLVYVFSLDYRFLYANEALLAMWGLSREDAIGKSLLEIGYEPWHAQMHEREIETVRATCRPIRGEVPFDGTQGRRLYDYIFVPVFGADGEVEAVAGTTRDVTERHEAEADRERLLARVEGERERLADVFRQAPAFICVLRGAAHAFEMANDAFDALVGQRPLLGRTVREAFPEVAEQGFIALLDDVLSSGEPFVGTDMRLLLDQAGEKFVDFVYQPLRDADGGISGVMVVGVDVTERHRVDEALRLSEERFRTLFDSMDEGFCVIELDFDAAGRAIDYRIELMNPAFEKHTGMRGLLGQSIRRTFPTLEAFWYETYGRVAATGEPARFVHQVGEMEGRWFDVSAFRIGGDGSRRIAILFNDITDRRRAEAERELLVQQLREQDRRKDEFLATLAHELRNPLAPIRHGLELIRVAGADGTDGTLERMRAMMERQLAHLTRLVDDLLDMSRVTSGKLQLRRERVDLRAVLEAAVETSRPAIEQASLALAIAVPDEPVCVDGDPIRLAQVVSNLLGNSAKYTPPGGRVRLQVDRDGPAGVITVADDGIGIPPAMLQSVFAMFSQVDRTLEKTTGGLGIGLSLVKGLVEMHDGTIEARSEGERRGSEFVVRLPLAPSAADEAATPDDAATTLAPSGLRRVLVVDDNVDAADSLAQLLGLMGNEVRTAYDGEAGLEAAASFRPCVLLCDIGMPKVNGYNVARQVRAQPWGTAIVLVALTGWGQEDDRQKSAEAGFDHHLVKPVAYEVLAGLLARLQTQTS